MSQVTQITLLIIGATLSLSLVAFGFLSIKEKEKEKRAARISFGGAMFGAVLFLLAASLPNAVRTAILLILLALFIGFLALFFLPIGVVKTENDIPSKRFDERMVMFARAKLQPGTPEYESYYKLHPEHEEKDAQTRAKPGLLSPQAKFTDPVLFAAPDASFALTTALRDAVDGAVAEAQIKLTSADMTAYIKELTCY